MFCMKCGQQLPDDALFCLRCRSAIAINQPAPTPAAEPVSAPTPLASEESFTSASGQEIDCVSENAPILEADSVTDADRTPEPSALAEQIEQTEKDEKLDAILKEAADIEKKRNRKRVGIVLSVVAVFFLIIISFVAANTEKELKKEDLVLDETYQRKAELLFESRNKWEKMNGSPLAYTFLQSENGELMFYCSYKSGTRKRFVFSNGQVKERSFVEEYGMYYCQLHTPSMPNYKHSASLEEKRQYLEDLFREMQYPNEWKKLNSKEK